MVLSGKISGCWAEASRVSIRALQHPVPGIQGISTAEFDYYILVLSACNLILSDLKISSHHGDNVMSTVDIEVYRGADDVVSMRPMRGRAGYAAHSVNA